MVGGNEYGAFATVLGEDGLDLAQDGAHYRLDEVRLPVNGVGQIVGEVKGG